MRAIADAKKLKSALRIAVQVCPSRTPMEILQAVKVVAGDELSILSTNTIQSVQALVPDATIECKGEVLLPGRQAYQMVSSAEGDVILSATDNGAEVICEHDRYSVLSEEPSKHPARPVEVRESSYGHRIKADSLAKAIRRTLFANDQLNARFALGGTAWDLPKDGHCFLVGTDERRAVASKLDAVGIGGHECDPKSNVCPHAAMRTIVEALANSEAKEVLVVNQASSLLVACKQFRISSLWLEGRFPSPWQRMMVGKESEDHGVAYCRAGDLMSGVKKSEILVDHDEIGTTLRFGEDEILLNRRGASVGGSRVSVESTVEGEPGEVKLNARFLKDWLSAVPAEEELRVMYPYKEYGKFQLMTTDGSYYSQAPLVNVVPANV